MPLIRNTDVLQVNSDMHPDIAHGEWFHLRRLLSWRQLDSLNKTKMVKIQAPNMFGGDTRAQGGKMDVQFDLVDLHQLMLETYIVDWAYPDPITPENIASIDPRTKDALMELIEDLQKAQLGVRIDLPKVESLDGYANGLPKANQLTD